MVIFWLFPFLSRMYSYSETSGSQTYMDYACITENLVIIRMPVLMGRAKNACPQSWILLQMGREQGKV